VLQIRTVYVFATKTIKKLDNKPYSVYKLIKSEDLGKSGDLAPLRLSRIAVGSKDVRS
jgi:hypothetical protein